MAISFSDRNTYGTKTFVAFSSNITSYLKETIYNNEAIVPKSLQKILSDQSEVFFKYTIHKDGQLDNPNFTCSNSL